MTELPQERLLVAEMAIAAAEAMFEWYKISHFNTFIYCLFLKINFH